MGYGWLTLDLAKISRENIERATSLLLPAQDKMQEERGEPKSELCNFFFWGGATLRDLWDVSSLARD